MFFAPYNNDITAILVGLSTVDLGGLDWGGS